MISFNNRIAKGQPQNTLAVIPHLVLDFASMGAWVNSNARWSVARVGGGPSFTLRGVSSGLFLVKVLDRDRMFPFLIRPEIDVAVGTPFARVDAGGAEVAPLMVGAPRSRAATRWWWIVRPGRRSCAKPTRTITPRSSRR